MQRRAFEHLWQLIHCDTCPFAAQCGPYELPIAEQSSRSTCSLAYLLPQRAAGAPQHSIAVKCSALGSHLIVIGTVGGGQPHSLTLAGAPGALQALPTSQARASTDATPSLSHQVAGAGPRGARVCQSRGGSAGGRLVDKALSSKSKSADARISTTGAQLERLLAAG